MLFGKHNFKEMYFVKTKQAQYTPVLCQNKLLAMSVSSLLIKDDIPVYHDMLSISTSHINFRILPNFSMY